MSRKILHSLGVDWFLPGKKRRFATSTMATSLLIVLASEEGRTVTQAREWINYDDEARDILRVFEDAGYGDTRLDTLVS